MRPASAQRSAADRRPTSRRAAALAFALAGCNAVLGNVERGIETDASTEPISSPEAGSRPDAPTGAEAGSRPDAPTGEFDAPIDDAGEAGSVASPAAFVQVASKDTSESITTAQVAYPNPQASGDLDVVVVGWSNAANVLRVSDSTGNSYVPAMAPVSAGGAAAAVYYAKNIAGSTSNAVTVTLDQSDYLCVVILEYSGVSQVDQTASGTGSGSMASTDSISTSQARELVLGVGEPDQTANRNFVSAGSGFSERAITQTSGMLVEDMFTLRTGSYAASGTLDGSSLWVMQVVAFR